MAESKVMFSKTRLERLEKEVGEVGLTYKFRMLPEESQPKNLAPSGNLVAVKICGIWSMATIRHYQIHTREDPHRPR
ncbi:MAG: hypothetical protein DRO13_06635 [Thermoprotei archaeon]|nr:MAG: hypothetical protein DRO13_06635 [Thermoprotei archaeon]